MARHSALAAGAIVQAAATLHSAGSQAHQTVGWTQGPHYPHRQAILKPLPSNLSDLPTYHILTLTDSKH